MTRKQRLFVYVAAGLATGLLVAGILIYSISRTELGMERARLFALSWLTERVDGEVKIGRISGRGLLRGVTMADVHIIDKRGRPFMRLDSAIVSYNWRTLIGGDVVIENATLFNPQIYFEQLPGDSIWNYQHVFPDRGEGRRKAPRRLILFTNARVMNGTAIVRIPYETRADAAEATRRDVVESVPGGLAKVMRFDSLYGQLPRVVWESPIEPGRLFDVRSLRGRGFVWRDPLHVSNLRGTVTLRDTIVAFDMPDVRMQSTRASVVGRVVMEEGMNFFDVRVDSRSFAFNDLHWLYPRLPSSGGGSGVLRIQSQRPRGILWLATDTRLVAPGTRLAGSFGVVTGADSLYFTNVDLRASPLNLELIQDMLPKRLPLDGLLVGTVEVKGGLSSLDTRGDVQLSNASGKSSVKWRGRFDVDGSLGAQNFRADVQKLDLALLTALRPELKLRGQVTGHVEAEGNVSSSIRFAADIHHYLSGFTSSFAGSGTYTGGEAPGLDVEMNARPLSLAELARSYPALERLKGDARGPIRLAGPLDNLAFTADLETQGGRALLDGRLMRVGEQPRYSGDATLYSFRLDELIADLPATLLDGKIIFDVAGNRIAEATGQLGAKIERGSVRGVAFTDAIAAMRLNAGLAEIDTLVARTRLGAVRGQGRIGLIENRSGKIDFTLRSDSVTGELRGRGEINGSVHSFDLVSNVDVTRLHVGSVTSDRVSARIAGTALGTNAGRIEVRARADSVLAFGAPADTAVLRLDYMGGKGSAYLHAGSRAGDEYVADAGLERQADGFVFSLRELKLGQRSAPWKLAAPTTVATSDHGLATDGVEVRRENGGRVRAAGRIAWHDSSHEPEATLSDFRLDFERVPFEEFMLVTVGTADVKGTLDGSVRVTGTAPAPVLEAEAFVDRFALGDATFDRLGATFTYAGRRINARVDAEAGGKRVLFADGTIPIDLAFTPVERRKLNEQLRFTIQADSMPATFLTAWVDGFTNVDGRLDGSVFASGTTAQPVFGGSFTLKNGNASWDVTGVRYRDVDATLQLESDRVARLDGTLKANGGGARVTGTIDLEHPKNPGFDLTGEASQFLAARRRDAEFTASGRVHLGGRYRQPELMGNVSVEQGALYLDELYRRFQIVELENPLLYDVVDTSIVSLRTILRTQNPFIKNLVVRDLRIDVGREAWLRSRDLNVEVIGDITIAFLLQDTLLGGQRTAEDLRLTGTLRAGRGTYQLAGPGVARRFALREGTIEFPGTPGVDPGLAFNAVYRAGRSPRREPIDIIAVVGGTLRSPRIRLTSDEEPPISESDLASYLFFGVPTYELTAGQSQALNQGTSGFRPEALGLGFATSTGFGYLANSLQTFAQNFGLLDYVSLTAAEVGIRQENAIASLFAGTRLELGRYMGKDGEVYIAYSQSLASSGYRPGVRLEWQLLPRLKGEFFAEDRFARTPAFGLETLSTPKRVYGLFFFREWTY